MRLLLVEDDPLNRDMLARRLRRRAYEVMLAADGAQALDLLQRSVKLPQAALLDLDMPVLDGWELLAAMRRGGFDLPVLILSAHSLKEDQQRAAALGVHAYLTKPLDFDELLQQLDRIGAAGQAAARR
jgi:CheY-like chemotaxis protein